MISFAAFSPHPPIIIPEIGQENSKYCQKTIHSMQELSNRIEELDIDTLIFISPHTILSPEHMMISYGKSATGSFADFGHPEISARYSLDMELAEEIIKASNKGKIPAKMQHDHEEFVIDHGALVPLYFLRDSLPSGVKLLIIGFSNLSRAQHFAFGQTIAKMCKKSSSNIGIIASGDLSHRILENGSDFIGKKFDQEIVNSVKSADLKKIMEIDENLQNEAGECGFRSLLILLGVLDGAKIKPEVLSYEAPFGVGYMVVDFNLETEF